MDVVSLALFLSLSLSFSFTFCRYPSGVHAHLVPRRIISVLFCLYKDPTIFLGVCVCCLLLGACGVREREKTRIHREERERGEEDERSMLQRKEGTRQRKAALGKGREQGEETEEEEEQQEEDK